MAMDINVYLYKLQMIKIYKANLAKVSKSHPKKPHELKPLPRKGVYCKSTLHIYSYLNLHHVN